MSAIGNVIGNAVDAVTGNSSGTTLQDFLSKFSSSEAKWVNQIDPFATFDLTMKFYPCAEWNKSKDDKGLLDKIGDAVVGAAKSAVKSAVNNMTGGLVGALMNDVDILKMQKDFKYAGSETFLEYLAPANLLAGSEDWIGETAGQVVRPLELQLGLYCQEAVIPNIEMQQSGSSTINSFGEFPINGALVKPDSNILQLKILNTKVALHERIFYPWIREVSLPYWSYDSQPYTTATITIDFTAHNDIKYIFCGCRPSKIMMQQAIQDASSHNITRDVTFLFDYMFITSNLKTTEDVKDKLLSTGKTLVNSAAKMINA